MLLTAIIQNVTVEKILGNGSVEITGIQFDSRKIERGNLFVATRGTATDGHNYISKAVELGALAVICEEMPENTAEHITTHQGHFHFIKQFFQTIIFQFRFQYLF